MNSYSCRSGCVTVFYSFGFKRPAEQENKHILASQRVVTFFFLIKVKCGQSFCSCNQDILPDLAELPVL